MFLLVKVAPYVNILKHFHLLLLGFVIACFCLLSFMAWIHLEVVFMMFYKVSPLLSVYAHARVSVSTYVCVSLEIEHGLHTELYSAIPFLKILSHRLIKLLSCLSWAQTCNPALAPQSYDYFLLG